MRPTAFRSPTASPTTIALLNERDGGINGVKIAYEECDTGYATDRGVECYERLKGKGPTGAAYVQPAQHRHHLRAHREGAGRQDPGDLDGLRPLRQPRRRVFQWNFPLLGTYWTAADIIIQHIAKEMGGFDKLKGKKIVLRLSRLALRQGADRRSSSSAPRCTASSSRRCPVTASRRRAEGDLAADPPEPAGLRPAVGLGRHELDRRSRKRPRSASRATRCSACGGRAPSPTCVPAEERRQGLQRR